MAYELLRAVHVEDHTRVGLGRRHQGDARGDVRLDQPGDDVDRRTLGRDDEMDPHGSRHLRHAADRVLDVARRHHHQVRELVDHDDDERHVLELLLHARRDPERAVAETLLVGVDVADADGGEQLVAHLHLADDPLQGLGGSLRMHDHRGEQVRHVAEMTELHTLRVDEDEPDVLGGRPREQRRDEGVHQRGLAGTGRSGDQQVRHLREVHHPRPAVDVLAQRDLERMGRLLRRRGTQDVSDHHEVPWVLGTSIPIADLPGIGAWIRTSGDASA